MSIQTDLAAEIEAYLAESGISQTAFGVAAVGDGKLLPRLRREENLTIQTLNRARDHLTSEIQKRRALEGDAPQAAAE
jgi:hypothetical protein